MQRAVCAVLLVATCGGITFREEPVDVDSSKSHSLLVRAPRGRVTSVSPQFPPQFSPQFPRPSWSMHIGRGRGLVWLWRGTRGGGVLDTGHRPASCPRRYPRFPPRGAPFLELPRCLPRARDLPATLRLPALPGTHPGLWFGLAVRSPARHPSHACSPHLPRGTSTPSNNSFPRPSSPLPERNSRICTTRTRSPPARPKRSSTASGRSSQVSRNGTAKRTSSITLRE